MTEPVDSTPKDIVVNEQENLMSTVDKVFQNLPDIYKRFALFTSWIMIMGGVKAGTNLNLLGDTYSQEEFKQLESTLESSGLRIVLHRQYDSKKGHPIRQYTVYNPQTLEKETASSKLVLPYHQDDELLTWIERCTDAGKNIHAVYGKLLSYPESAIKDFVRFHKRQKWYRRLEKRGIVHRKTIQDAGETYWFFGEPSEDVIEREKKKKIFFDSLNSNKRYQSLKHSETLKESDKEWVDRLP